MKRILVLTVAPFMVSAAFAGPALADGGTNIGAEAQVDADVNADVTTDSNAGGESGASAGTEIDAGTTASTGDASSFGSVISAIQTSGTASADISSVTDGSQVRIVRVSDIAAAESMDALENALSQYEDQVEEMRAAISANSAISTTLEQEGVQVENVVAAATEADGSVVIYVR